MAGEIRLVRSVRATRAELWQACSTPSGLEGWYADRVTGALNRGGSVRLEWPELGAGVDLDVAELVPNERLVFRNGDSRVAIDVADGKVSLAHEGLADDDDLEGFRSSWHVALAVLTHALEAHPGAGRRTRWAARPARTTAGIAHLCFTEPEALRSWLAEDAIIGAEGERYSLTLGSGERMSGRVLVRSGGRDVALTWEEQHDSVVVLRTLPSPKSDRERVVAACWSKWGPTSPGERAVENELRRALERLAAMLAMSGEA
jgi:uncharacterized protein YndB with AHSA1/START domain